MHLHAEALLHAIDFQQWHHVLVIGEGTLDLDSRIAKSAASVTFAESLLELESRSEAKVVFDAIFALDSVGTGINHARSVKETLDSFIPWLAPNGFVTIEVANRLSLSGLSGDATGGFAPFEAIEGVPIGSSREPQSPVLNLKELEDAIEASHLRAHIVAAFGEADHLRCVFGSEAWQTIPTVVRHAPRFTGDRPSGSVEGVIPVKLWGQLIDVGLGFEMADYWIAFCSREDAPTPLGEHTLGVIFHGTRTHLLRSSTTFSRDRNTVNVNRTLFNGSSYAEAGGVQWVGGVESFHEGTRLDLAMASRHTRNDALVRWIASIPETDPMPLDHTPWNLVDTAEGLKAIDQEWWVPGYSRQSVIVRGLVYTIYNYSNAVRFAGDQGDKTVQEVTTEWAQACGLSLRDVDFENFVTGQSAILAIVGGVPASAMETYLKQLLDTPLKSTRSNTRVDLEIAQLRTLNTSLSAKNDRMGEEISLIKNSRTWRLRSRVAALLGRRGA